MNSIVPQALIPLLCPSASQPLFWRLRRQYGRGYASSGALSARLHIISYSEAHRHKTKGSMLHPRHFPHASNVPLMHPFPACLRMPFFLWRTGHIMRHLPTAQNPARRRIPWLCMPPGGIQCALRAFARVFAQVSAKAIRPVQGHICNICALRCGMCYCLTCQMSGFCVCTYVFLRCSTLLLPPDIVYWGICRRRYIVVLSPYGHCSGAWRAGQCEGGKQKPGREERLA